MHRREFLKLGSAGAVFAAHGSATATPTLKFPDLASGFAAIGFDPAAADSDFFVVVSDLHLAGPHLPTVETHAFDQRVVDAINGMSPLPSQLVIAGDIATSATEYAGKVFNAQDAANTTAEMHEGLAQLGRFDPSIAIKMIPGNHDTPPYDDAATLWCSIFGCQPYQTYQFQGLPIILLNSGHSGDIEPAQQAWFAGWVGRYANCDELLVIVHHPLNQSVGARGVTAAMIDVLPGFDGDVWLISGHNHRFDVQHYSAGGTSVIEHNLTTGNPVVFNDGRNPGFAVVCVRDGKIVAHFLRDVKRNYYELTSPDRTSPPGVLRKPFDVVPYPILIDEVVRGAAATSLVEIVGNDVSGHWWFYVGSFCYEFNLRAVENRADTIYLLVPPLSQSQVIFRISSDRANWQENVPTTRQDGLLTIEIPAGIASAPRCFLECEVLVDRFLASYALGGAALARSPAAVTALEQWRFDHFGTILDQGEAAMSAQSSPGGPTNLHRYAFKIGVDEAHPASLDPRSPERGGMPSMAKTAGGAPRGWFVRRSDPGAAGLSYAASWSPDLADWQPFPEERVSVQAMADGWELVELNLEAEGEAHAFFFQVIVTALE